MNNIILGNGEVASAITSNLDGDIAIYDKGQWEDKDNINCNILHITIPFSNEFVKIVSNAQLVFLPDITVIHSTVKPGISDKIENCLYSPVLGRHADAFAQNIKMYIKFFAGDEKEYEKIKDVFKVRTEYWGYNKAELEYTKIMSTTMMYWYLVFNKELEKDCKKNGYDYINVYYRWLENYNHGIGEEHPNWKRPIYEKMVGDIPGGHCLSPNIQLVENDITRYLTAYERGILYMVTQQG